MKMSLTAAATAAAICNFRLPLYYFSPQEEQNEEEAEAAAIDSGLIEVILFAIPFMLLTNLLVVIAIFKDNVWLLLPWMVLHCVVIAFLALGAAILTAHGRGILGSLSLLGEKNIRCIGRDKSIR